MLKRNNFQIDLRSPYEELEHYQRERLLKWLIITSVGITLASVPPYANAAIKYGAWQGWVVNILQVPMFFLALLSWVLLRRGKLQAAGHVLFPYVLFLIAVDGVMGDVMSIVAPAFIAIVVTAGVLLGASGNLATAITSFVLWVAAEVIAASGIISPAPLPPTFKRATLYAVIAVTLIWTAVLNHGATTRLRRSLTEANYVLIQANRQLGESSRLKSRFVARVSHDLRTPLNAIMLTTDLVHRELYGTLTSKQKEALGRVGLSARHLGTLIDDILDISRIEAGELRLTEDVVEVESLVEAVKATVEPKARNKGLVFLVDLSPDMPSRILGDEGRLTQILINLADNAVKFTEEGEVSTFIEPVKEDRWRLVVRDTGHGIHENDLEVIFEEFRQAESTPSGSAGGTGLGLAITRHLVQLMRGEIKVDSKLGKGSTFEIVLPLKVAS